VRPEIAALAAQLSPRVIPAHAFRAARFRDGRLSTECYELLPDPSTHGGRSFCLLPVGEHVFGDALWNGRPVLREVVLAARHILERHTPKTVQGTILTTVCRGCSGAHSDNWVAYPCAAAGLALLLAPEGV
jgi:hypothetical protein